MKVAIVCDWLIQYAGAEHVLEQILKVYPEADLFCIVDFLDSKNRNFILNKKTQTSFIQNLPFARKYYQYYLPLMPIAIEQFDLSKYDLIISSSHAVAKGIITSPDQIHISYVHSPLRYAWDLQYKYLEKMQNKKVKSFLFRMILHYMRIWDSRTSNGVDFYIANSKYIGKRIKKVYGRESDVIYPPVDTDKFILEENKSDYFVTVSRLVPYKNVDIIIKAFNELPNKKLFIIGKGSEEKYLKSIAKDNITFLGYQDDNHLRQYVSKAKAFIYAAEEDFGISPVEAQACGTPVIALKKGGTLETVRDFALGDNVTGVLYAEQSYQSLKEAIDIFEENKNVFDSINCRDNALKFSKQRFLNEFVSFVKEHIEA